MKKENLDGLILGLLQPILKQLSPEEMPALVAALERMATRQYLRWADEVEDFEVKELLQTGERNEQDNAAVIERLFDGVVEQGEAMYARFPDLATVFDRAFAGLSLKEQWTAQAAGERVGADLYRSFTEQVDDEAGKADLLLCAEQEQANADLLLQAIDLVEA